MKTRVIFCFLCACSTVAWSQSAAWENASRQELVAAYRISYNWFINTPSYSFKLNYISYGDAVSKEPIENSEGYYKRVANNCVSEIIGIKTLQNANLKVVVDTADRLVTVTDPGNLSPAMTGQEELMALLDNARGLKKMKQSKSTRYHIDFKEGGQYEAYEFIVNDKGQGEGLTYYYQEQITRADGEGEDKEIKMKPRLEIRFSDYQVPAKYTESEFSERGILVHEKGKLNLTAAYRNFRLLDYRLQAKK